MLSKNADNHYSFENLSTLINEILDKISSLYEVEILTNPYESYLYFQSGQKTNDNTILWKDEPSNIDILFGVDDKQLSNHHRQANKALVEYLRQARIIKHLLAAYETPKLYEYYFHILFLISCW